MNARLPMILLGLLLAAGAAAAAECVRTPAGNVSVIVCRVDLRSERLRLFHADARGRDYRDFETLRADREQAGETLIFAMNAGMYHPDFRPVGLLVIDGHSLAPINRASGFGNFFLQPNGVFMVDEGGAHVLPTHEYRNATPTIATQSGPMLVDRGLIPDIPAFRPKSGSRFVRNGVCAPTPRSVAFVISEQPVNFFEFAQFFRDNLGCRDALYLDGSISSLYAPQLGRADHHAKLGPMFAVTR